MSQHRAPGAGAGQGSPSAATAAAVPAAARGADLVARELAEHGVRRVFALSGNHVMSLFDAAIDAGIEILHVRHEAAAVHMADAWGRLTGEAGVALVTGGPGHANAVSALYTAKAAESPVLLLSGHSPLADLGRGAFQEMPQAQMAALVCKAATTARSAATLPAETGEALRLARGGRRGPVHLSLPSDLLEARVDAGVVVPGRVAADDVGAGESGAVAVGALAAVAAMLASARRPLIVAGPGLASARGRGLVAEVQARLAVPAVVTESPRGIADPSLGAFAEVLSEADAVVLAGKSADFTLRFGAALAAGARVAQLDPDLAELARTRRALGARVGALVHAEVEPAMRALAGLAGATGAADRGWLAECIAAIAFRPPAWASIGSRPGAPLHPLEVCREVAPLLASHPESVLVCDGGEFGQWVLASLGARHRLVNGVAGAIGAAIPFALSARLAFPHAPVLAFSGDGAFGFHPAEYDTAVRHRLPFVAIVGNDACWNAERQIQLREYGSDRAAGCTLLPTRYDRVAAAFGGHGEHVASREQLAAALQRAVDSGLPACIDVSIESTAAPAIGRAV